MATFSESEQFISRSFGSKSMQLLYKEISKWCAADGLLFFVDDLLNIRIRSADYESAKNTFVTGSHLDTVVNAGKYDGPLGFLIAYEMLVYQINNLPSLNFNLEVVGFSDEEGVRFQTTYLGSSAIAGIFDTAWLNCKDDKGITLKKVLKQQGCSISNIKNCAIDKQKLLGYYEVHIEQGPVLQQQNLAVALVNNIYGQIRIAFKIHGEAGHAGTVPMHLRKDALSGFAEFATELERHAFKLKKHLVATIGKCAISPNASNVIPAVVTASVDIRSADIALLKKSENKLQAIAQKICDKRNLTLTWKIVQLNVPVTCNAALTKTLKNVLEEQMNKVLELPSGAGHDGVAISKVAPICMLFVRCKDGISHHPKEFVKVADIKKALQVSLAFIKNLAIKQK